MNSYGNRWRDQSGFFSSTWTLQGSRALVPAEAPFAHLPPLGVQTDLSESLLVLRSSVLVDDPEFYLMEYSRYLHSLTWKTLGIPTQALDTGYGLVKRYQEYPPSGKILGGGCLKDTRGKKRKIPRNIHSVERWGGLSWKIQRNTWGLVERYWGCSIVGDCVVCAG